MSLKRQKRALIYRYFLKARILLPLKVSLHQNVQSMKISIKTMRCLYLISFSFLFPFYSNSQELSKFLPLPGVLAETAFQIEEVEDGVIMLVAFYNTFPDSSLQSAFGLMKTDFQGNLIWSKIYNEPTSEEHDINGQGMVILNDTIYVAFELYINDEPVGIKLMAINLEGLLLFTQNYVVTQNPFSLQGMIRSENSLCLVIGITIQGHQKIRLVRLDNQLNLLQEKDFGNPNQNKYYIRLSKLNNSGYVLAYSETAPFSTIAVVITRVDDDWNELWSKKILPSNDEFGLVNINKTQDGGYFLTWQKNLEATLFDTFPYPTTVYKLDSAANIEWEYCFVHHSQKSHISATKLDNDQLLVTGVTDYWGFFGIYPERGFDGWCAVLNQDGQLVWERNIADLRKMYGGRLWHGLQAPDGKYILVGDIDGVNTGGGGTFLNDIDVWFLTLDENGCWNNHCNEYLVINSDTTTSTKEPALAPVAIKKLYPNPTSGEITIEWGDTETSGERLVQIVDLQGKIVAKFVAQAPKTSINLSQLPQGVYFITAIVNGTIYKAEKLILQHH